jgi:hypothetical protein
MKKVVFLIGMMVGFASTVFGQYEHFDNATIISSRKDAPEMGWFKYSDTDSTIYLYGTVSDVTGYAKEYVEWATMDYSVPTYESIKGDRIYRRYDILFNSGVMIQNEIYIDESKNYAEMSSRLSFP